MPEPNPSFLLTPVLRVAGPLESAWLEGVLAADGRELIAAYTGATRRFRSLRPRLTEDERGRLVAAGIVAPSVWGAANFVHAALLLAGVSSLPAEAQERIVRDVFRHGDTRERESLLRALVLLPGPARHLPLATEACRSSVREVFEAIACENAYPVRFFSDHAFNQMVLKAMFVETPLARIAGLPERRGPELVRMAAAYASERQAAGRPVPPDLVRITGAARRRSA